MTRRVPSTRDGKASGGAPPIKKQVLFIHGAGEGAYEEDRLLADSLRGHLGPAYEVRYPRMQDEDDVEYEVWKRQIAEEMAGLEGEVVLVGHSVGASVLVKLLSEELAGWPVSGLFLLAAPFWGADDFWKWDEARLPEDAAARLAHVPQIRLYHSRDDRTVPFAHLALYAAMLPRATLRELDGRGHQLGNDLAEVAEDIRSVGLAAGR